MPGLPLTYAQTLKKLIDQLLDKGYNTTAKMAVQSVARSFGPQSAVGVRLQQFEDECKRLRSEDKVLASDNPVLAAVLHEVEASLERSAAALSSAAPGIVQSAVSASGTIVKQAALPGIDPMLHGIAWNSPDPEAIARIANYTSRQAWMDALNEYEASTLRQIRLSVMNDVIKGSNPLQTARNLRSIAEELPVYRAQSLARTLQLTAYRDASVLHGLANADILQEQIRIAVLDKRTCPACIALHGTVMRLDERVNDHESGRCTSVFITKGRKVNVMSGSDWFDQQPADTQRAVLGGAGYAAYKDGAVALSDYPTHGNSPVFGEMIYSASLNGILGPAAKAYYRK